MSYLFLGQRKDVHSSRDEGQYVVYMNSVSFIDLFYLLLAQFVREVSD